MKSTWWENGSYNAICDSCGLKFKQEDLKLRWDGLMVCSEDWETRHPQDLIRSIPDQKPLPWTRPDTTPVFWAAVCTPITQQGVAGYGTAGCARAGYDLGYRNTPTFI